MKALKTKETIFAYLYLSKKFTIHTDASGVQLGEVIMQEGKPPAFYSKKWSKAQINYTMKEKELLSIVKAIKELQNILLGHSTDGD